ncbi:hypothetical protein [Actinacidiphila bryophytorum]|uniref:Uncharacterized protein n=1 Tax=Actinacidiphila bryophytorum TaxID=1436133 RepID=A0A9W4H512_9ACTN|nr:hypothetical protein [Actinacidiphila bryophytorum]MBM9437232.1 hypothetical protein [Actinacidiphila bryophytorum]MBN6541752.1 hypothetical protein [Actinacidiphila bryophytorum]CAG7651184.1 conserved hypothetical protein [Actinacidiphila bryophytorum]
MTQLADRLSALAASGGPVTFHTVGLTQDVVTAEVAEVAAGPYAPLLAEAVAAAFDQTDPVWAQAASLFPAGFAGQGSLLALTGALETLLGSSAATTALAGPLNTVLLDGLADAIARAPMLAAARLEGAVRLAAANAVRPWRVWEALEQLPADGPEDFTERLPRILGVALDCWAQQEATVSATVRTLLEQLSVDESADVDALFELGCDRLRSALSSHDLVDVSGQLGEARRFFSAAQAAEEARDDAAVYAAVCDAVLGFTAGNTPQVAAAADRIEQALERRAAWLYGTHQPAWLQPRRSAEIAWSRLLLQLRAASQELTAPVRMDQWQALDAVLAAYRATRTIQPVGNSGDVTGLATLIEPAIEDGFLREQSFLNALRHAAAHPQDYPGPLFDAETAAVVIARINARETSTDAASEPAGEDDEEPGRAAACERLHRIAPTLVLKLGTRRALSIADGLDDDALASIEGLAYNGDVARLKASDPLIVPLLDRFIGELSGHPDFTGDVRQTFSALVEQTLLFLKSRSDLTRTSLFGAGKDGDPPYDYRRKPEKGQRRAVEADLQRDFHGWLQAGPLHNIVFVEPTDMGMGRADVLVHFGSLRYLTEMKQDSDDNTRAHIEAKYLTQEAEYTNTNAPFGQLLVLDLTPKSGTAGTRRIDELTWLTTHRPQGAHTGRWVLAGIVTGNRLTPSAYSR